MEGKILAVICLLTASLVVHSASINSDNSDSSEEQQRLKSLESIKEFVRNVEKYNLNVSLISSHREYASRGWAKELISITWHMPTNKQHLTEPTLDDSKQKRYLEKMERLAIKENCGARIRVIPIKNGEDQEGRATTVNSKYVIDSNGYDYLTTYKNELSGFKLPINETSEILYNYIINNPASDGIVNIQIVTGNVVIEVVDITEDFPPEVLREIKKIVPKLYLSTDEKDLLARLIGERLDKTFNADYQILIGVDKVAIGKRPYAHLTVGGISMFLFNQQ
ncbi:uncharacterized protein [Euwallacea fornicatus]|uniref:uncharacterized protein n=1 Tax=Euwallacea fornicatus TaxID=995702 RepID=UPI00338FF98E